MTEAYAYDLFNVLMPAQPIEKFYTCKSPIGTPWPVWPTWAVGGRSLVKGKCGSSKSTTADARLIGAPSFSQIITDDD